jgi:hypothetical protein
LNHLGYALSDNADDHEVLRSIRAESAVALTRSEKYHEELSMLGAGGGCRSYDRRLRGFLLAS